MKMKKRLLILVLAIIAIILAIILAIYLSSGSIAEEEGDNSDERVYAVETIVAQSESYDNFLSYSALIQPKTIEQVTFASINTIDKIHVSEGDEVTVGQLLVSLDENQARQLNEVAYNEMLAAENAMNVAKLNYNTALDAYNASLNDDETVLDEANIRSQLDEATQNRDDLKAELDEINESVSPFIIVRDNAQIEVDAAQNKYNDATDELKLDPTNPDKIAAQEDALKELGDKTTILNQAQNNLDTQEDALNKTQVEAQLEAAETSVELLQLTYDNLQDEPVLNTDVLYTQSEAARLTYDASQATYNALKGTYETSQSNMSDLTYEATVAGTVLTIVSTEGSVVTPLAPVMVIGSEEKIAQFGIASDDSLLVQAGTKAEITIKGNKYTGEVDVISAIPDEMTRTYLTDVSINNAPDGLLLGEVVTVKINLGETPGIWVPLSIVLNDGEDHIFVVEDERATRKNIKILEISDDKVLVSGINEGEIIISQGMKSLKSGYKVSVVE